MYGAYKGVGAWERAGWWGAGGQAEGGPSLPLGHIEWCCALNRQQGCTNHKIDWYGHWQQFGTQPILISAPHWANRPCNAPSRFYGVGKKPSVKADLAIYSHAVDVRGQCMSESLILGHNLDFSSCDINWKCLLLWHEQLIEHFLAKLSHPALLYGLTHQRYQFVTPRTYMHLCSKHLKLTQ